MIHVVIAGFGFMGAKHAESLRGMEEATLAGVADPRLGATPEHLASYTDDPHVFPSLEEALARRECDAVIVCLPTDLHPDATMAALAAGKHVFCEKPIALTRESAELMTREAQRCGRQLMVGHCLRFWPEYETLRAMVKSGEHGRLVSLSLTRHNERPDYAIDGWVFDPERCAGAALDMHIHDTDMVCHLLGLPHAVASRGVKESSGWNAIATIYDFGGDGPLVRAEGAWNFPRGRGFRMQFTAVFETACLDFDSGMTPSLTLTAGGRSLPLHPVQSGDGYQRELAYFLDRLRHNQPVEQSTGEQATESLSVVLAEIESAASGGRWIPVQA